MTRRTVSLVRICNNDSVDATTSVVYGYRHASELLFRGGARGNGEHCDCAVGHVAEVWFPPVNND
jgi:hypothetical protein